MKKKYFQFFIVVKMKSCIRFCQYLEHVACSKFSMKLSYRWGNTRTDMWQQTCLSLLLFHDGSIISNIDHSQSRKQTTAGISDLWRQHQDVFSTEIWLCSTIQSSVMDIFDCYVENFSDNEYLNLIHSCCLFNQIAWLLSNFIDNFYAVKNVCT